MVSGYKTEIAVEGTLFYIQTEARKEAGIETAVYVKGAVVHSLKTPHPGLSNAPAGNERRFMRFLEEQYQQVIAQIRSGGINPSPTPA